MSTNRSVAKPFYVREFDGATMIEVAPHRFVAVTPSQALGLISWNEMAETLRARRASEPIAS